MKKMKNENEKTVFVSLTNAGPFSLTMSLLTPSLYLFADGPWKWREEVHEFLHVVLA